MFRGIIMEFSKKILFLLIINCAYSYGMEETENEIAPSTIEIEIFTSSISYVQAGEEVAIIQTRQQLIDEINEFKDSNFLVFQNSQAELIPAIVFTTAQQREDHALLEFLDRNNLTSPYL